MAKSVSEVLDAAADLIEPEGAWTQRWTARSAAGTTYALDPAALCWCAAGAIIRANGGDDSVAAEAVRMAGPVGKLAAFNDGPERTQAEVVAKLREAAAKAREQGL